MDATSLSALYRKTQDLSDPPLPSYLAAVRTLVEALSQAQQPPQTLAETLALLSSLTSTLKSTLPHATAIAISAGTDTFQRQLVTSLARGSSENSTGADPRNNVIKAGEAFVQRHLDGCTRIAAYGSRFIRPGMTLVVPTCAPSQNIESMLREAAGADVHFRVIFVQEEAHNRQAKAETLQAVLKEADVPTATISTAGLTHALAAEAGTPAERQTWPTSKTMVLADAVAIMASGGTLGTLETQCAAAVAHALGRQVWVVAETGKIVRDMELDSRGSSDVVQWSLSTSSSAAAADTATAQAAASAGKEGVFDVTPAKFITGIITEDGPRSTTFIAEEAIKIWF